jgi:transposase
MLAEVVDAVVGVDTHRDVHEAELAAPNGSLIARLQVANDSAGFAQLLAWIVEHAPGPRVVVAVEGTRSYGIGLTRALTAAGLQVIECEQPARKDRRGRGKSDAIDAHLAVLFALRQDADRLPTPVPMGPAKRCGYCWPARQEMVTTCTGQINRLRALLLSGEDADRRVSRSTLTAATLSSLARRRLRLDADRHESVRHQEIRRLAIAVREANRALKINRRELQQLVDEIAPGLIDRPGIGPVSAAHVIVSYSHPGRVPQRRRVRRPSRHQPTTSQQRPDGPTPTQPRRRPSTKPCRAHHRAHAHAQLRTHARLRRPTHHRRQDHPRDPPCDQALHNPASSTAP